VHDCCANKNSRKDGKTYQQNKHDELEQFGKLEPRNAIETAAISVNSEGKQFLHQWRITKAALQEATKALLAIAENLRHCSNFDELYTTIGEGLSGVHGVRSLYTYDVALKI
jgi:hypothetical protein